MTYRKQYEEVGPDGTRRIVREETTPDAAAVPPVYAQPTYVRPVNTPVSANSAYNDDVVEEDVLTREPDSGYQARRGVGALSAWVGVALAIVETLLAFRLAFGIFGANRDSGFVDFIYTATGWLVAPFQGIAEDSSNGNGGVFEPGTLIAMAVYLVAALLAIAILNAVAASTPAGAARTSRRRYVTRTHVDDYYTDRAA